MDRRALPTRLQRVHAVLAVRQPRVDEAARPAAANGSCGTGKPEDASSHRNGASGETVLTDDGPLRLEVPRDRDGSFAPLLIPKHERSFTGFDDKIIAMCARGMTMRQIQGFLAEQYGTEVRA